MCNDCQAAARPDSFDRLVCPLALALDVAWSVLAQEALERFFERLNITFFKKQLREVCSTGQAFAARFHLFQTHFYALLAQGVGELAIPIAPVFPLAPKPIEKLSRRRVYRKVTEEMNMLVSASVRQIETRIELNAADQIQAGLLGERERLLKTGKRVVIGYSEGIKTVVDG